MNMPGLITRTSQNGLSITRTKLISALELRGMDIIARIDHSAAAKRVGMHLNPTEVFIFGNPRVGTPLMNARGTLGLDLPLKILVWQDEEGSTLLTYNDPKWLAQHHSLSGESDGIVLAMSHAIEAIVQDAAIPIV
ncbi:DUF302 domain-containing protein [Pseudomonas fluorescens]|uniref:DUF302 domain-containing protein n=1 Tax=Pseudomonas fluorescens TaxID=294 RepID=UPI00124051CD|nr:DUF302 domain-containing protein [Pseudomonas fluorescens]VVN43747.1 hypothetical protein PS676_05559 [Pseudomonas fluorescens]